MLGKFASTPLMDQLIKDMKIWGPTVLSVALCPCGVVLKGRDLGLELLIELLQLSYSRRMSWSRIICSRLRFGFYCSFIYFISQNI